MMDGMSRLAKVVMLAGLLVAGAGAALLVVFLVGQGLDRAGQWATVLSFGLTAAGTVASIWAVVLVRSPADVGDVPDGERAPDRSSELRRPRRHYSDGRRRAQDRALRPRRHQRLA
jgi:hypothetical protein